MFDPPEEKDDISREYVHYDRLTKNVNVNIFPRNLILNKFDLKYNLHINEVVHMMTIDMIHFELDPAGRAQAKTKILSFIEMSRRPYLIIQGDDLLISGYSKDFRREWSRETIEN